MKKTILFIIMSIIICSSAFCAPPINSFRIDFKTTSFVSNRYAHIMYFVQCGQVWIENYRYDKNLIIISDGYELYQVNVTDDSVFMSFEKIGTFIMSTVIVGGKEFRFLNSSSPSWMIYNGKELPQYISFWGFKTIFPSNISEETSVKSSIVNGITYDSTNWAEGWGGCEYSIYDSLIHIKDGMTSFTFGNRINAYVH